MAIPNLLDNTENKDFKIENFIDISEADQFLKLPGIEDIVFTIEEIFGALGEMFMEIMKIVKAILSLFNIGNLFDALGLKKLFETIFNFITGNMTGFGLSASDRESLRNSYISSCMNFNESLATEFGFQIPSVLQMSLIGVLMAMLCTGVPEAGTSMYNLFASKNVMPEDDLKNLFGKTVGTMVTMQTSNSLNMLNDNANAPYTNNIYYNNTRYASNALTYINNDNTRNRDQSSIFDNVVSNISAVDSAFNTVSNISIFNGADRFKSLSRSKNLSITNPSLISNPTQTSSDISLSVLSLF